MSRDITTRRQLDQQLREALEQQRELVHLKSQFVNTVSHEFRTPLGVILTSADILTHYLDRLDATARQEHLKDIHRASVQMARMLDQVLDLGRIEAGKLGCTPRPLDLPALLHRITDESHSASSGCRIELHQKGDLDGASADESLLRHIFYNVLSNARKYSSPEAHVEFTVRRENTDAVFTVRDDGIGIPNAAIPHLFEAFSRAANVGDTPGTGLGLAIVKRCTDLHGGTLHIESEEGRGTLVTIRLPLFEIVNHQ
jgi:signal transduction histidine kinase